MPVRGDPSSITSKWVNRLSGATAEIQAGIARVTVAPGAKAAQKSQKWLNNTQAAHDKFKRNVGRVSLSDWQNAATTIGVPRIAQGAQQKQGKMQSFLTDFIPHLERGLSQIDNMPDDTMEARIQKSVAMMRHNANFKRPSA
jgi:hypothetical protein